MMTEQERQHLAEQWKRIHDELDRLENLSVQRTGDGLADFGQIEQDLLGELDEIEYKLGEEWLKAYRRERGEKDQ